MATIGLVPLILMLITRTPSIPLAQVPTHPTTPLVGTAALHVVFHFYFTRSGLFYLSVGSLRNVGDASLYWSKTTHTTTTHAYLLDFDSVTVYPSVYNARWLGFLVRCLANHP